MQEKSLNVMSDADGRRPDTSPFLHEVSSGFPFKIYAPPRQPRAIESPPGWGLRPMSREDRSQRCSRISFPKAWKKKGCGQAKECYQDQKGVAEGAGVSTYLLQQPFKIRNSFITTVLVEKGVLEFIPPVD